MATTDISSSDMPAKRRPPRLVLRDKITSTEYTLLLHAQSATLKGVQLVDTFVADTTTKYDAYIELDNTASAAASITSANASIDEETAQYRSPVAYDRADGKTRFKIHPNGEGGSKLFKMSSGLSILYVGIEQSDGTQTLYHTDDIICLCHDDALAQTIEAITNELGSDALAKYLKTMLAGSCTNNKGLAINTKGEGGEGGTASAQDSTTYKEYLDLIEKIINLYDSYATYMRASAYGKIEKNTYVLPASSARRTSREALTYAATHPGTCNKDARGKLRFLRILDDRLEKNIDNNENAIVVAFLEKVKSSLHTFVTENKHKTTSITAIFQKIQLLDASANVPTALKTIETALKAETQLTKRAIELESRVNQTIHVYMQIFPNLFRQRIWRLPTRSRAFIEIEQYSRLYNVMKEFAERKSFSSGLSDVLLSLTRMDNLYEYYCLAKLLQTMDVQGWALSKASRCAYKVHDRKPRPDGIADKYIFKRGESTATLYYEPVMYGTEREEEGIDLHRLHLTDNGNNAYLTPDFYLRITDAEGERRYIFDAKLRRFDENTTKTANDALIKYKLGLASGGNDRVDGLWLFMGRDAGADLFPINNTTFARTRPALMTDGLAQLSPEGSALPKLAQLIGIANLDLPPVIKARHLSESAAGEDANASTRVASTNTGTLTTTNANLSVNPAKTETQLQPETKPTNISDAPSKNKPPAPKKVAPKKVAAPAPSSTFEVPADVLESIKTLLETAKTQGLLETKDFANTISAREPLLRKKPPQGRGKQRYSASPIEICGEEYYVYTHWPPNLIKKLKDKAEEYELKHKETEPQDDN